MFYLPTNIEIAPADGLLTKEDISSIEMTSSVILIKSSPMIYPRIPVQPPLSGGMTAISSEFFKFIISSRSTYVSFKASIKHEESASRLNGKINTFSVKHAITSTSIQPPLA